MKVYVGRFCSNCGGELPPDSQRHTISRWWATLTNIERAMMIVSIIIIISTIGGIIDEIAKPRIMNRMEGKLVGTPIVTPRISEPPAPPSPPKPKY
jgi:hypothetical protein